ncbi:MAG: hypothetical protein ACM3X4_13625 [Ignavibacteriales bacterium]
MDLPVVPVANAILPRPDGGAIRGVFLDPVTASFIHRIGAGGTCLLLPHSVETGEVYPVGVIGRLEQAWLQTVYNPYLRTCSRAIFAELAGRGRGKARSFRLDDGMVVAEGIEPVEIDALWSKDYPVIDGAGWQPVEGATEMKGLSDLPVTIYGYDLESGERVELAGNVGGLIPPERAHTVEHAMIRCLKEHAICTPKNLADAVTEETMELKQSLELGFAFKQPEVFGVTNSGQCGNPLTSLAHFYLAKEFIQNLKEGQNLEDSLEGARLTALSRISSDLGLSTRPGLRVMQGLKQGMLHDDTTLSPSLLKKVLRRFPKSPWS